MGVAHTAPNLGRDRHQSLGPAGVSQGKHVFAQYLARAANLARCLNDKGQASYSNRIAKMFRLSRIHAPRATLAACVLLAAVLLAFGLVADAHVAESVAQLDGGWASDWSSLRALCVAAIAS